MAELPKEKATPTPEPVLIDRIMNVLEDAMKAKLDAFEHKIDAKLEEIVKAKEIQVEQALRKGLGVESDPVIHASDLSGAIRRALLEQTESQKKTPAPTEKAGPDGNVKPDPFDELVKAKIGEPVSNQKTGVV